MFEKLPGEARSRGHDSCWTLSGWDESPVGARRASPPSPDELRLAIGPNPFNPTTAISYQLSTISFVNLSVYDITGRKVAELVNGRREAGAHTITWNADNQSSGIYIVHLQTGAYNTVQKILLLK